MIQTPFRAAVLVAAGLVLLSGCGGRPSDTTTTAAELTAARTSAAAFWNSATVYFLLTDRFANGDSTNDLALGRAQDGAVLRSFKGGDLARTPAWSCCA